MTSPRTEIDVVSPLELGPDAISGWSALQAGSPEFASPYLSPQWARTLAALGGPDRRAKVAVLHDQGTPKGFLAVRIGRAIARPIGAPVCDYQGMVAAPGLALDPRALLKALRVTRLDFTHLLESQAAFSPHMRGRAESLVIDLQGGFEAYQRERRPHTDVLQDAAKKRRKLERERGEIVFTARSADHHDLNRLIGWKQAQYRATRQTDIFDAGWPRDLLHALMRDRTEGFGGLLFTLHVGGALAAAHYALEGRGVLHAWFIAHDEDFCRYSPGVVLLAEICRWAADQGVAEIDLGPGDYRFKQQFANARRGVAHGFVGRPSARTLSRSLQYGVRSLAEALPLGRVSHLPAKAMRRMDVITGLI